MSRLVAFFLVSALGFTCAGLSPVRADDKKKDPEAAKQEKKDKDLKKAKEDMEKELKAKKVEPGPALGMMDKLAGQVGLEVGASKEFVHKILGKKIPWDQASSAADTKMRECVDTKTFKVDTKKFSEAFSKWISEWKPEAPAKEEKPKEDKPKK